MLNGKHQLLVCLFEPCEGRLDLKMKFNDGERSDLPGTNCFFGVVAAMVHLMWRRQRRDTVLHLRMAGFRFSCLIVDFM